MTTTLHSPPASPRPIEQAHDADLRLSQAALRRAAQSARNLAARTGTALIVQREGKLVHIEPVPLAAEQPLARYAGASSAASAKGDA
ncbi:MAG: hypothetical protein MUC68_07950 [Burkholderiaceae bacterium]|jgi:hypothetical protein|nr:hypothetical protein [Burkholderiaceae bacterium]